MTGVDHAEGVPPAAVEGNGHGEPAPVVAAAAAPAANGHHEVAAAAAAGEQDGAVHPAPNGNNHNQQHAKKEKSKALVRAASSMHQADELNLTFSRLDWTVRVKNPSTDKAAVKAQPLVDKKVLNDVSGLFRAGRFTAVMGSSGAGKTTLLNVVAGYGSGGVIDGSVLLNGVPVSGGKMRDLSGYVHQHDIILPTMTVREAVTLAAFLRLPRSMADSEKHARVEEVMRWLGLVKIANNQIGSPEKKGISGGERRRVSVAMELVRNPGILFLDEPTSGLDTFTAYSVAHLLRSIAHQHRRTIVATIHQPSSEIFHLFDDLVLLDQGRVIYAGPAADAMSYFRAHLGFNMPRFTNPADYLFMHILNADGKAEKVGKNSAPAITDGKETEQTVGAQAKQVGADAVALMEEAKLPEDTAAKEAEQVQAGSSSPASDPKRQLRARASSAADAVARQKRLASTWNGDAASKKETPSAESLTAERVELDAQVSKFSQSNGYELPSTSELHQQGASLWTQFQYLCRRARNDVLRNPFKLRARIGQVLFIGLFISLVYLQVGLGQSSIQNRSGVLFFLCGGGTMNAAMGTVAIFASEKSVFTREYGARMYSLPAFFFSKLGMELPLRIIFPIVQASFMYFAVGLSKTAGQFWTTAGTMILLDFCGTSIGLLLATIAPTLQVALAMSPMILLPLMLFSGFFLNSNSIPPYFNWISYISPIKYAFIALAKNEYTGLVFTCDDTAPEGQCQPYANGEQVLQNLNFDEQPSIAECEGILIAIGCGCLLLAYLALWRSARKL